MHYNISKLRALRYGNIICQDVSYKKSVDNIKIKKTTNRYIDALTAIGYESYSADEIALKFSKIHESLSVEGKLLVDDLFEACLKLDVPK